MSRARSVADLGNQNVLDLNASEGTLKVGAGATIENTGEVQFAGIVTAQQFAGDITGVAGTFTGNLSVGGVLTYEDVTSVDSVGIITARSDVSIADSIFHIGDGDTAIRFPAADTFTVETAGEEKLRITSDGGVLIGGHTSPVDSGNQPNIEIVNTSTSTLTLARNDTSIASGNDIAAIRVWGNDSNGTYQQCAEILAEADGDHGTGDKPTALAFKVTADGASSPTERLRITSDGKIGINNTDPLYAMHLKNAMGSSPSFIHMEVTGDNYPGGGGGIRFDTSATSNIENDGLYLATISGERTHDDNGSNRLVFKTSKSGVVGDDGNTHSPREKVCIDPDGRLLVGVSTTTNNGRLCVKGDAAAMTNGGAITIQKGSGVSGADQHIGTLSFGEGSANTAEIKAFTGSNWSGSSRETYLTFETTPSGSAGPDERMRIDSAGRLLVGSTSAINSAYTSGSIQLRSDAGGVVCLKRNDGTNTNSVGILEFHSSFGRSALIAVNNDGTHSGSSTPGEISFQTTPSGTFNTPAECMKLANTGAVTVKRASTHTTGLQHGLAIQQGSATNGNRAGLVFKSLDGFTVAGINGVIETHAGQQNNNVGSLEFYTKPSGVAEAIERMSIRSDGKIYIGPHKTAGEYGTVAENVPYKIGVSPYGWANGGDIAEISMGSHLGTGQDDGQIVFKTATNVHSDSTGLVERFRIDELGKVRIRPYGLTLPSTGEMDTPVFVALQGNSDHLAAAGAAQTFMLRTMDCGSTINANTGYEIRNRSSGDLRILNRDSNISNRATLRIVQDTDVNGLEETLSISYLAAFYATGIYDHTTSDASNVNVASGGQLRRSTSSIRFKRSVETIDDSYADALLNCRPVWYRSTAPGDNPDYSYWGFIAEEVAEIDPRLVQWSTETTSFEDAVDSDGNPIFEEDGVTRQKMRVKTTHDEPQPESVAYDRFVPHLVNIIKRQKTQIENLETRIAALENN